ncbi:MAG: CvpA family protein [bacterium]|nr:CvpA family protein [Candidatus Aquidulcis sp.]
MNATILVDLVVVVLLVIAAWSGGRTGAARSAVSFAALVAGLYISAQGQGVFTQLIAQLVPSLDSRVVAVGIFIGGAWLVLAVVSYLLGRLLQATLRALHLGPLDTALGAIFGVVQWVAILTAILFLCDATVGSGLSLPEPFQSVITAISSAQSSEVIRGLTYPIADTLVGGLLPEGLRALLRP